MVRLRKIGSGFFHEGYTPYFECFYFNEMIWRNASETAKKISQKFRKKNKKNSQNLFFLRYFLLELKPDTPRHLSQIHQGEVHSAIMKALKNLHGEQGVAAQLGDIRVKYLNPETGIVFLRARRGPHELVREAINSLTRIGSHVAKLEIVHLSGTMRSSQKRLLEYHRRGLLKMLAKCHTDRDREKIRLAMSGLLTVSGKPALSDAMDTSD